MKIIEFPEGQRSEAWHKWRSEGITATDISILMGKNPFKTPLQLWEEKHNYIKPKPPTPAMLHGIRHESDARKMVNHVQGWNLQDICVQHDDIPHFRASLDGYDAALDVLCEIKCPMTDSNKIHDYWMYQVQWQMMISEPKEAYICIYRPYAGLGSLTDLIKIEPDRELMKEMMWAAQEFWGLLQKGIPPELSDKDRVELWPPTSGGYTREYEENRHKIAALQDRQTEIKNMLTKISCGKNFKEGEWLGTFCSGPSTYDYDKMRDDGIDLDKYKKPYSGQPVLRLQRLKEKGNE